MSLITISCPHCGFSKQVEQANIPENVNKVTCKQCQKSFQLPKLDRESNQEDQNENSDSSMDQEESAEFTFLPEDSKASHIHREGKFCPTCGAEIHIDAEICPKCGVRQPAKTGAINKIALLLVTFFLGGLGGHRFYQKKYWLGALYLVFFWTYIPSIVAFIEFVIYAFKSEAELQKKYPEGSSSSVVFAVIIAFVGIAIIGILAAIAIPQFAAYRQKAYEATATSALKNCKTAVESYYVENQSYPVHPDQFECETTIDVALYYLPISPEEYQIISYHGNGQKAFLSHSDGETAPRKFWGRCHSENFSFFAVINDPNR